MIRLLYGEETYLINKKTNQITGSWIAPVIFDETSSFESIVEEIANNSLFSTKKELIIRNPSFLKDKNKTKEFVSLIDDSMSQDEFLVIIESKTLAKNSLLDYVKKTGEVFEFKKLTPASLSKFVEKYVEVAGGTIDKSSILMFTEKVPNNLWIVKNELDKLLANNLNITKLNVSNLVSKYYEDDFFEIIEAISTGNMIKLVNAFEVKKHLGINNMIIISQISKTLSLAHRVLALKKSGYTSADVSNSLSLHIYRVKKLEELILNVPEQKIKSILVLLANLENDIKTGRLDENNAIDYLVLNLIK